MSYSWTGLTYQEKLSAGQLPVVFGMAFLFTFLFLAALYESWSVPFSVLLGVPLAAFGAILGAVLLVHLPEWLRGLEHYYLIAYGAALLLVVILAPEGLAGIIDRLWHTTMRRAGAGSDDMRPASPAATPACAVSGAAAPLLKPSPEPTLAPAASLRACVRWLAASSARPSRRSARAS